MFIPTLKSSIDRTINAFGSIPEARKEILARIAEYVRERRSKHQEVNLTYICTHNSRRSHMAQLWAKVASVYYGIDVNTFSGGTEVTAFNPRAVAALKRAGFKIFTESDSSNPIYSVYYSDNESPQLAWSKKYQDESNPQKDFAAIMTCSSADKNCPIVFGANARIAIPYEDPKVADNTEAEIKRYDERSHQIATEMMYCFSLLK